MSSLNKPVPQRNHVSKVVLCLSLLLLLAALAVPLTAPRGARAQGQSQHNRGKFIKSQGADAIPDSYIVVLKDDTPGPDVPAIAAELARSHGGVSNFIYQYGLKGFSIRMPEAAAEALSRDPRVEFVEEAGRVHLTGTQFNPAWGLDRIDQRSPSPSYTYTYANTGAGVHVYVIDTGIDIAHEEFGGRAVVGTDLVDDDNRPDTPPETDFPGVDGTDCLGHGTAVAALIGGKKYGVAKGVTLHSIRFLGCDHSDPGPETVIAAINWVNANRIEPAVVNMSLGYASHEGLKAAVRKSINDYHVTYVISAGQGLGDASQQSPANVEEAITVGATDSFDAMWAYSNYGRLVDVFAPGVGVRTAKMHSPSSDWQEVTGTSFSAPYVAGVAALYLETHSSATPAEVGGVIRHTATKDAISASSLGPNSPNRLLFSDFPMGTGTAALFRYWNPTLTDHYYTANFNDIGEGNYGWDIEKIAGFVYNQQVSGTVPLYRYWNQGWGDHFYTTNFNELGFGAQGWSYETIEGYVYSQQQPGTVPLYRYWNSSIGDHYYTTDFSEYGSGANGYTFEWTQCYVLPLN